MGICLASGRLCWVSSRLLLILLKLCGIVLDMRLSALRQASSGPASAPIGAVQSARGGIQYTGGRRCSWRICLRSGHFDCRYSLFSLLDNVQHELHRRSLTQTHSHKNRRKNEIFIVRGLGSYQINPSTRRTATVSTNAIGSRYMVCYMI